MRRPSQPWRAQASASILKRFQQFSTPTHVHEDLEKLFLLIALNCALRNGDAHLKSLRNGKRGSPRPCGKAERLAGLTWNGIGGKPVLPWISKLRAWVVRGVSPRQTIFETLSQIHLLLE